MQKPRRKKQKTHIGYSTLLLHLPCNWTSVKNCFSSNAACLTTSMVMFRKAYLLVIKTLFAACIICAIPANKQKTETDYQKYCLRCESAFSATMGRRHQRGPFPVEHFQLGTYAWGSYYPSPDCTILLRLSHRGYIRVGYCGCDDGNRVWERKLKLRALVIKNKTQGKFMSD